MPQRRARKLSLEAKLIDFYTMKRKLESTGTVTLLEILHNPEISMFTIHKT